MTGRSWPRLPLGELLSNNADWITIEPETDYHQITARLWGKGLSLRGVVKGASIAAAAQLRVRSGQFLISRIDARHGAFGLVPPELDGAVTSSDFPTFTVDARRLDPHFLQWMSRTAWFVALCRAASEGSTNRVRLKEARFLTQTVPIPSLPEQHRIVALLDAASAKVASARERVAHVRSEALQACRNLVRSAPSRGGQVRRVGEFMWRRPLDVNVIPEQVYNFAAVYSFGRGVFRTVRKRGAEFSYPTLTRLRAGDFTYPKLMAWEGALGVIPPECAGLVVSPEFPVFQIDVEALRPEVADVHFRDPEVWPTLSKSSPGTNLRRRRLNPEAFLALPLPVPSRADQDRLVAMLGLVRRLDELATATEADLGSLIPSLLHRAFSNEAEFAPVNLDKVAAG